MKVMDKKVGFIGAGNMASALISGMINAGFKPENIIASSPGKDHLDLLSKKFGVQTSNINELVFKESEVILYHPGQAYHRQFLNWCQGLTDWKE